MRLKATLLSAFALISLTASAQDKIYKKGGDVIEGKVKEVTPRNISYKRTDNPDGPDYVINRNEVERIKYQNGTEDYMDERRGEQVSSRKPQPRIEYGKNILSVALINLSEMGYGVGIAYERSLDRRGMLSFYLPVNVCLGGLGTTRYDMYGGSYNTRNRTVYQVMPGVKFYPTGNQGKVRYAVGPQLVFQTGTVEREQWIYDPLSSWSGSGYYRVGDAKMQKLGVMINNSLNMYPTQHLYLGMDLGLGLPYSHKEENISTGEMVERGTDAPLVQFNFRLGFRF
jgi:hypothetical protein